MHNLRNTVSKGWGPKCGRVCSGYHDPRLNRKWANCNQEKGFASQLGSDTKHDHGVRGDLGGEGAGGLAEVLFGPELADCGGEVGWIGKVFPGDGNVGASGAAIEQNDGAAAILQLFGPDFGVATFANAAAPHAELILIDGDDFLV